MIRFRCSNCGREYVLPDALAHLPLVCKGCGHRLDVPDPQPEPDPPRVAPLAPARSPFPAPLPPAPARPAEAPMPAPPMEPAKEVFSSDTLAKLEFPSEKDEEPSGEPAVSPPSIGSPVGLSLDEGRAERSRRLFARLADAVVVLVLLGAGVLVGEIVTRKSSEMILREAAAAPQFPPIDLLVWLGCVVFFPLIYAWLGTRGWTLGAWLQRREK